MYEVSLSPNTVGYDPIITNYLLNFLLLDTWVFLSVLHYIFYFFKKVFHVSCFTLYTLFLKSAPGRHLSQGNS